MSNLSILNLTLSAVNAYFAWESFRQGHTRMGWFNICVSAICFVGAVI